MKKSPQKQWRSCPTCKVLVYAVGLGCHVCHQKVRAKVDAEQDFVIDMESAIWDTDLKEFWASTDVKSLVDLAEKGKI